MFNQQSGSALGLMDLFSGGTLRRMTIFALGIMPYITASIIFQLLTVVYEPLARIQKEGELGRRKITQWTRYMTVVLGALQSIGIAAILTKQGLVLHPGSGFILMTVLTLTTGTAFIMWLGEQITDRGIGNGMSLLIFAGIVAGLPRGVVDLVQKVQTDAWGPMTFVVVLLLVAGMAAVVAFIVFVERSERRIPIQSARRIVGRRMMGGQSSHLPLKVNSGGVMPIIFASSILSAPLLFGQVEWVQNNRFLQPIMQALTPGYPWYELLNILGIIFFAYFYVSIVMRPDDIADNFRKSGSFIPGIRPGKRTSRLYQRHSDAHYAGRRALPDCGAAGAHLPHFGHPFRQDLAYREVFRESAQLDDSRHERQLLLWRHFTADCGGCGHGYGQPDRIAADHASL